MDSRQESIRGANAACMTKNVWKTALESVNTSTLR